MIHKINCQIINLLINEDFSFSNKYKSVLNQSFDYKFIMEEFFDEKGMRNITVNKNSQSICFSHPTELVEFYNPSSKKVDKYYEEIHIHCNSLEHFDKLLKCLEEDDNYSDIICYDGKIPHYEAIYHKSLQEYELILEPMTNAVDSTKHILKGFYQKDNKTIFRAIAIHFCNLVNKQSDITIDLIHNLDNIYDRYVNGNDFLFFDSNVANSLLDIMNYDNDNNTIIGSVPTNEMNLNNNDYIIDF